MTGLPGRPLSILIVEDDPRYARLIKTNLDERGYRTDTADIGADAQHLVSAREPDLVLLDLGLPDVDGLDVLARLREFSDVPVVIVTARGSEDDIVRGLEAGADDYLSKPFGIPELMARIHAVLRRSPEGQVANSPPFELDGLRVDFAAAEVKRDGEPLELTATEYRLLHHLALNAGKVLVPDQLLEHAWGPEYVGDEHLVRVYVSRLRHKIEKDPRNPHYVLTRTGVGYMMARPRPDTDASG